MIDINKIRKTNHSIVSLGSHQGILQSMLDFDFLCGKEKPNLVAIIASGRKYVRLFWGGDERLIPVYQSIDTLPRHIKNSGTLFLNLTSGRRTLSSTVDILGALPHIVGGAIFAENVPEKHSLELFHQIKKDVFIIGPATVGLMIPGQVKLGAIGGTQADQLIDSHLFEPGNTAVFSSSGGMTNELIQIVTRLHKRISFSLSFGGDRFPILSPVEAFLAAENDANTNQIVYFGELGGYDEYDLIDLIQKKRITKKIIAYIGGTISEMFETPPQFGHAKAMAERGEETAQAKTKALQGVGVFATNSFTEFIELVKEIPSVDRLIELDHEEKMQIIRSRTSALFMNSISRDVGGSVEIVGDELLSAASKRSYGHMVGSMLLGRQLRSSDTAEFVDLILKLLVDHGPYVSGAVNTMIAARAGKDLVSSLASGLLTIGPRFGGAINQAASHWFEGVSEKIAPHDYVEQIARWGNRISGIGHRKYRIDAPDPRVGKILQFSKGLTKHEHVDFACAIERITTAKKGNLILNVDGAIAAVLLDLLSEKEKISRSKLKELVDIEFFNALFVLARSVGFTAHYLDQRRLDEGLFRLSPKEVGYSK